jgi:hypothetical protein
MDAAVLKGLHTKTTFLSFEYNTQAFLWETAVCCFQEASRLGFSEAKFTRGAASRFISSNWVPVREASVEIRKAFDGSDCWGDVLLR